MRKRWLRTFRVSLVAGLALCAAARIGLAVGEVRPALKRLGEYDLPGLRQKISLAALDKWSVTQFIQFLANRGSLNIIVGRGVAGEAGNIQLKDVTIADALEIVLSINNLAYDVRGDIITIMPDADYQQIYGRSCFDQKQARIVTLAHADPVRIATQLLQPLKSPAGTIVPDPVTGTLILIDTPEKIREMSEVIRSADVENAWQGSPTVTETFVLQYAKVDEIQGQVRDMLTREAGKLQADARTRTLLVTDTERNMERVRNAVLLFDRRPRQVFIEAKIVDVTLSDAFSMGINWDHVFQALDPRFSLRSVASPGAVAGAAGTLTYKTIVTGGDLSIVLQALGTIGKTEVLSNPHIAVVDGEKATIEVVEDQPYKEIALEAGTTNVTGVTYLFKKVGVQLGVTPRVNDDGLIAVEIRPEVSQITEWYDGLPQSGTPVIRKSLADTKVIVKDGVTVIIGGMIKNEKSKSSQGIPLLSKIPLLGVLFRTDGVSSVNRETVVFMTPRIVTGDEPVQLTRDIKKQPKPLRPVGATGAKELKPLR